MEQQTVGSPAGEEHPVLEVDRGRGGRRAPRKRRGWLGCLVMVVVLALVVVGGAMLVMSGIDRVRDLVAGPADYSGTGSGSVLIEVEEGDSAAAIGRTLKAAGVVASVDAFVEEATGDERSRGIQVGFYEMAERMSAESALEILVNPDNLIRAQVTVPEGLTVPQTVAVLADETDFSAAQYRRALRNPQALRLPAYARGDPEGYLFPATYEIRPNATARSVLRMMVDRFKSAASDLSLVQRAEEAGMTPHDVVTVASIIEREVRREQDLAGVAEVVRNRLAGDCSGTGRLLQMDSTVHFAAGDNDSVFTSDEMRAIDSPYNTYKYPGLPPGPIAAPGEAALEAALNPTDEGWCFFVAVDLETGETAFARTGAEHADNRARLEEFCAGSDLC
jgi:UPF0755 protein